MSLLGRCAMAALVGAAPYLAGCGNSLSMLPQPVKPVVTVSQPVERDVLDYVDFIGQTAAVNSVEIRPRVTGYLVQMPFKEGDLVKANEMLFEVDPRPYQAQLDQAQGDLVLNEAKLKLAKADNARAIAIAKTPGAISQQDLDHYQAAEDEAQAAVEASTAALETYRLNLEFTRVLSPVDGQVSRYFLTLGNLVNQDATVLTTVVSIDPMYVYFDIDERTILRVKNLINEGKLKPIREAGDIPVYMALQGETGFPHQGTLNFVNNQVDPTTGTITVRGVYANPIHEHGVPLLTPGMFVRVRLPIGKPAPAVLVADQAIGTDQGLKFVYIVDEHNQVQYRRVETGALQDDGLRVITGVNLTDWVVISGLQLVQPRMDVDVDRVAMPVFGDAATAAPGAATPAPITSDTPAGMAGSTQSPPAADSPQAPPAAPSLTPPAAAK